MKTEKLVHCNKCLASPGYGMGEANPKETFISNLLLSTKEKGAFQAEEVWLKQLHLCEEYLP